MAFAFRWRNQTGTHTDQNRDYGGIGLREDVALCIIVDGATRGRESGDLARRLATEIVDWFVGREVPPTPETTIEHLRVLHTVLFGHYAQGSASYLIVFVRDSGSSVALHAGDCLLGRQEGERIVWLSTPHPGKRRGRDADRRYLGRAWPPPLVQKFSPPRVHGPDQSKIADGPGLILATDGFWADCSVIDQDAFIRGAELNDPEAPDDRSCLLVWHVPERQDTSVPESSATLYVRSRTSAN